VKLKIRPMLREDKPALMEILHNTPEFSRQEVAVAEEVIDSYLYKPDSYNTFVAELGESVAGYICYGRTPLTESTWDIYWLAVSPDRRRQGVGGELTAFAEERIEENGGRLIIIETSSKPEYEKTWRFYLGHGYEVVGRIPDFYAPNDDKIILHKRIKQKPDSASQQVKERDFG
jgi:ribosomal protein S18 acetylase RimI-like enzyme